MVSQCPEIAVVELHCSGRGIEGAQVIRSLPGKGRGAWWAAGGQGTHGERSPLPLGSSWGSSTHSRWGSFRKCTLAAGCFS